MNVRLETTTPSCSRCERARDNLKAVAQTFGEQQVTWRDMNLLDELPYAVELGVLSPPSMAIDGEMVFAELPHAQQLHEELTRRLGRPRDLVGRAHGA